MPSDKSAQALLTATAGKVSRVKEIFSSIPDEIEKIENVVVQNPVYAIIGAERTLHESSAQELPIINEAKIKEIS